MPRGTQLSISSILDDPASMTKSKPSLFSSSLWRHTNKTPIPSVSYFASLDFRFRIDEFKALWLLLISNGFWCGFSNIFFLISYLYDRDKIYALYISFNDFHLIFREHEKSLTFKFIKGLKMMSLLLSSKFFLKVILSRAILINDLLNP